MAHSFVPIQLLAFFINAKSHFYCSRELLVFGLEKKSVRKQDLFFAFYVYKKFCKTIDFCIWMKITMTTISKRQGARLYIYIKSKRMLNVFIYKNWDTLLYAIFCWSFEIGGGVGTFLYPKNDALCVTFLYPENNTLCVTFLYLKFPV